MENFIIFAQQKQSSKIPYFKTFDLSGDKKNNYNSFTSVTPRVQDSQKNFKQYTPIM